MRFENSAVYLYLSYKGTTDAGNDTTYRFIDSFLAITPRSYSTTISLSDPQPGDKDFGLSQEPIAVGSHRIRPPEIQLPIKKIVESYRRQNGNNNVSTTSRSTAHLP